MTSNKNHSQETDEASTTKLDGLAGSRPGIHGQQTKDAIGLAADSLATASDSESQTASAKNSRETAMQTLGSAIQPADTLKSISREVIR